MRTTCSSSTSQATANSARSGSSMFSSRWRVTGFTGSGVGGRWSVVSRGQPMAGGAARPGSVRDLDRPNRLGDLDQERQVTLATENQILVVQSREEEVPLAAV